MAPKEAMLGSEGEYNLYKAVFEHAHDAIFLMERGVFTECNLKTLEIFGCNTKDDILGKTPFHFSSELQPDGEYSEEKGKRFIKKALEGEPQTFEWFHKRLNGEPFWAEVSLNRIYLAGEIPKVLAVVRDISVRKTLERQLAHAQRMEAIGVLAAGMAHDFNNMLGAIMGNLNLISLTAEEQGKMEEILKYSSAAEEVVMQAAQITKRLLAFTRQTPISLRHVDPVPVVEETVEMLSRTIDRRISIETAIGEGIWEVRADPSELQHILMNLCLNAKDTLMDRIEGRCAQESHLSGAPPTITISVKNRIIDKGYCVNYPFARTGRFVAISIKDNGCGMDETTLNRIFDPFFTTKELGKGTGLGLAMVYGLVKQHKGWIIANSSLGYGSIFTFYIPALEGKKRETGTPKEAPATRKERAIHGALRILLAEDERVVRDVGRSMLEHLGHEVVTADNGEDAVRLFKETRPDLVFMDITMPKLSGKEALMLILEHSPRARVVISSGHQLDRTGRELLEMGAKLYLQKPYRIKEVKEAVEKAMGED